jgi:hypothetical protein
MSRSRSILLYTLVPAVVAFMLFGCPMYTTIAFKFGKVGQGGQPNGQDQGADPVDVLTEQPQVTLAWDPPTTTIEMYKMLFRAHGTNDWYLLGQIQAEPNPQYIINHVDVGNGIFDFGVIAANNQGQESVIHTSLDTTAQPDTGWYLVWHQ